MLCLPPTPSVRVTRGGRLERQRGNRGSVAGKRLELPRARGVSCSHLPTLLLVLLAMAACKPQRSGGPAPPPLVATPLPSAPEGAAAPDETLTPALDATLIAKVPEGTFGPYVSGARGGGSVALWAAPDEGGQARWFSVALDSRGAPIGNVLDLAPAPKAVALARLRATPRGFVALVSHKSPGGTAIDALELSPSGELVSGPTTLAQNGGDVLWLETLSVGSRPLSLWAALDESSADIHVAGVDAASASTPVRVLEGASAWQAVEYGDGIGLVAMVGAGAAQRVLRVTFIDAAGRTLARADVRRGEGLTSQLDAISVGERLLVAWVERSGHEDHVFVGAIGPDARLEAAPAPASAFGQQRLIQLLAPSDRRGDGYLVWENVGQAPWGQRALTLARLSAKGEVDTRRAELEFVGAADARPEIVTHADGIAALTRAPICSRGAPEPCSSPAQLAFVELGPDYSLRASEPLQLALDDEQAGDLAWGLTCGPDGCTALTALTRAPVPIYGVELRARSNAWRELATASPETPPRARSMEAADESEPLAEVAAAQVGDRVLVATLGQFDESTPYVRRKTPAPDGRLAPLRARLTARAFTAGGALAGAPQVISYRARSTGGIALASAPDQRALLAWTALDNQRSEVFATLVSRSGKSLAQRMITLGTGNVSAVSAASLPLGFVVAWIAERGGEPQITAARLNSNLSRAGSEHPLTQSPGAARGLSLLSRSDETWLAWIQATDREQAVRLSRLDNRSLSPLGDEVVLHRTEAASLRSLSIVARGEGALVAWIEHPAIGNETRARAWLLELGPEGRAQGAAQAIGARIEDPTAVRIFCADALCQGVIDSRPPFAHVLSGFAWSSSNRSGEARRLAYRASVAADPPALALIGAQLFYGDREGPGGLLRHLEIAWR